MCRACGNTGSTVFHAGELWYLEIPRILTTNISSIKSCQKCVMSRSVVYEVPTCGLLIEACHILFPCSRHGWHSDLPDPSPHDRFATGSGDGRIPGRAAQSPATSGRGHEEARAEAYEKQVRWVTWTHWHTAHGSEALKSTPCFAWALAGCALWFCDLPKLTVLPSRVITSPAGREPCQAAAVTCVHVLRVMYQRELISCLKITMGRCS